MRDFRGIGRHHQVPADQRQRGDVADFPVAHPEPYTLCAFRGQNVIDPVVILRSPGALSGSFPRP
jgi:hypothetical protein